MDLVLVRILFVLIVSITCYLIEPFGLASRLDAAIASRLDAAIGAGIGLAIVLFEWRLRRISLKRLIGAAIGSVLGIFGAYLFALVIRNSLDAPHLRSFLQILVMLLMAYVGLIVGANKGDLLNLSALGGIFGGGRGAAIGAASGAGAGGAVQVLTKGQRVRIPAETRLSFTLQNAVRI